MAEEKEKSTAAAAPKKSKTVLIAVAAGLVVLLIIGGAIAFFALNGGDEEEAGAGAHQGKAASKKRSSSHDDLTVGPMVELGSMVVNLMSESGNKFAKISVALELDSQELTPEMMAKKAIASDIVLSVISSKTAEELMNIKGKEAAKNEIMEKVNERLKDGRVKNVYITNFVVQ